MEQKNDFSKGSMLSNIISMAVPTTMAQLINVLYNVVDRIYLSRIPDEGGLALTGLGITMPVISILMGFANLCGVGGAPLCSIERGRGDYEEAERVMGNAFTLLILLGLAVTGICLVIKEPMLRLFGASDATLPYASQYLEIYLCGTLFVMVSLGMNPFINAQGFAKLGMLTVALGAAVNIILDPIFIYTLEMGVRGAALATILAQGCSAVWVMWFLTGKRAILRLKRSCMKLKKERVKRIVSLGTSGFCVNLTNSLVQIVCNATLQIYGGDLYVGVMTIINSVREVVFMPARGLNNGAQPVLGFNYGARKYGRVLQGIRIANLITIVYSAAVWAVMMAFPAFFFHVFNADTATLDAGVVCLRVYFCMFLFMSLQTAGQCIFVGLGRSKNAIFFSLLRKAFINAPLTILLPRLGMGIMGVFVAEAVSQFVGGLACFGTMILTVYLPLRQRRCLEEGQD